MARGDSGTATGPLALFCARLKRLQLAAGIKQTSLARTAHRSTTQISDILNGNIKKRPDWDVIALVVHACLEHAERTGRPVPPDLRDEEDWRRRYGDLEHDLETKARPRREALAGWPLADVTDPFALEVHRPVKLDTPQRDLPVLPVYVPREHDIELERVVMAAVGGTSSIAVLVGASSTGKTRACWEALRLLRDHRPGWRLWHPIDPSRPEAALQELPSIGPRTVVWLNEAQFYLDALDGGTGERVAARLRELLRDPGRGPVLVLATIWPQFWDTLTIRPPAGHADPHAQARELLSDRDISVPSAFTPDQVQQLTQSGDPRLALAAASAADRQVVQFLAGAPKLLARYRHAPSAAKALISAAMDARRLGMGVALPQGFLEAAAAGYLTESEWDALGDDWLEQALVYTAPESRGTRGPLTRIRPRPPSRTIGRVPSPAYRLADYLDQHGRQSRRSLIPPAEFWTAAADFADPGDLETLARAGEARGLLRDAAGLRKRAAAQGNASAAAALITSLHSLHPADSEPARWVIAHAPLDNPDATAKLLDALSKAGAPDCAAVLLAHDPARHAALNDLYATARLLDALRKAGAAEQVKVLAARAAAHAPLGYPHATARLLDALREAGAADQAEVLLARDPARQAPLDDPDATARLLDALRSAGAADQAAALLARAAAHAPLDNSRATARLLDALREAGAADQVKVLAARAAAHAPFDDPHAPSRSL